MECKGMYWFLESRFKLPVTRANDRTPSLLNMETVLDAVCDWGEDQSSDYYEHETAVEGIEPGEESSRGRRGRCEGPHPSEGHSCVGEGIHRTHPLRSEERRVVDV